MKKTLVLIGALLFWLTNVSSSNYAASAVDCSGLENKEMTKKEVTFCNLKEMKQEYIDRNIAWYDKNSRINWIAFRAFGVLIILGGTLLPFLNHLDGDWPKRTASVVSIIVAISAGLSGYFSWQKNWGDFRAAQFRLENLARTWDLEMLQAAQLSDEEAVKKAVEATQSLFNQAQAVISQETGAYFAHLEKLQQR